VTTGELIVVGILAVLALAGAVLWVAGIVERVRADRRADAEAQLPPIATEPCELCKAALGITLVAVRIASGPVWLELVCYGCAVEGVAAGRHTIVMPNARRVRPAPHQS
jgi:hypothetical protein